MLDRGIVWVIWCGFLRLRILIGIFDLQSIVCWLDMTIGSRACLLLCDGRILRCNRSIAYISIMKLKENSRDSLTSRSPCSASSPQRSN